MKVDGSVLQAMRADSERIFRAALAAADPEEAILRSVKVNGAVLEIGDARFPLDRFRRILVVGAGKADAPMARALEQVLGDRISAGVIVVKEGHGLPLARVEVREAAHPVPDGRGMAGTDAVLALAGEAGQDDLVLSLFSGGGSALLVGPAEGLSLEDKQEVTRLLLACGATIHEINAVRKHLSRVKGGGLARAASPATVVSLILSDVVGDNLDAIASGPTVPDSSTFVQAAEVLRRYRIWEQVPQGVRRRMEAGLRGEIPETPKPQDPVFRRSHWELVGSNIRSLAAAKGEAERLGYGSLILGAGIEGETREVAKALAGVALEVLRTGNPIPPPACILSGGETTVTLRGDGKGGRNQEFALAAALALEGVAHVVVLSGGTDGTDGPTDAAGAVADGESAGRARSLGRIPQDHLERNDAYPLFHALGDLLMTGPTRTNVMDVRIMLVRRG
jgi:hydroxypyruvate reductase